MCGRYSIGDKPTKISVPASAAEFCFPPRYNAAPSQKLPVILFDGRNIVTREMSWGITRPKGPLINARHDKLLIYFGEAAMHRRCLIPANGFYEWQTVGKTKQPWRFYLPKEEQFCFAGIYHVHVDDGHRQMEIDIQDEPPPSATQEQFAIITVEPNQLVAPIHNRMPAIVGPGNYRNWLVPGEACTIPDAAMPRGFGTMGPPRRRDIDFMTSLQSFPKEEMAAYPCDPCVNNPRNDNDRCFRKVSSVP